MKKAGYYIFYSLAWLISLLPFWILYGMADLIALILHYLIGYRKKVVRINLQKAFPEKNKKQLRRIERSFYRHLADLFVEVVKLINISQETLKKRYRLENPELLNRYAKEERDIIIVMGHYGNWEWMCSLPKQTNLRLAGLYKPLKNKHFDRLFYSFRSRFGLELIPMHQVLREMINRQGKQSGKAYVLIADQSPVWEEIDYWTPFLNQPTPVYLGPEKLSRKFNMPVVFLDIRKKKRGHYSARIVELIHESKNTAAHQITNIHVQYLEQVIQEQPEYWMWSHRRWKHKPTEKGA